jgi:CHAT domain-containing protein
VSARADLDLSGLELVVLSACESGVGSSVRRGEGVLGLQQAFHLAGCKDVVSSLWKVDDDATAALMGLFYRYLWVEKLPPLEALRRAQLYLLRHPAAVPALAKRRGSSFLEDDLPKVKAPAPGARRLSPYLWAGFVLSGTGR